MKYEAVENLIEKYEKKIFSLTGRLGEMENSNFEFVRKSDKILRINKLMMRDNFLDGVGGRMAGGKERVADVSLLIFELKFMVNGHFYLC